MWLWLVSVENKLHHRGPICKYNLSQPMGPLPPSLYLGITHYSHQRGPVWPLNGYQQIRQNVPSYLEEISEFEAKKLPAYNTTLDN